MNKAILLILCIFFCATIFAGNKIPADVQKHIDAVKKYSKENKWNDVRKEYQQIDWRKIEDPLPVLREISKDLKNSKDIKDIRKAVKTKYNILKDNNSANIEDPIEDIPISVVEFSFIEFSFITYPGYQYLFGIMKLWENRYDKQYEALKSSGIDREPKYGTALWAAKENLKKSILNGEDYSIALSNYNQRVKNAEDRRNKLK